MRRSEAEQGQVQGNAPVSSKPRSAPPLRIGWNKLSACNVVDNRADRWSMYDDLSLIPNTIGSFTLKVMIRSQVPLLLLKVLFPIHRGFALYKSFRLWTHGGLYSGFSQQIMIWEVVIGWSRSGDHLYRLSSYKVWRTSNDNVGKYRSRRNKEVHNRFNSNPIGSIQTSPILEHIQQHTIATKYSPDACIEGYLTHVDCVNHNDTQRNDVSSLLT